MDGGWIFEHVLYFVTGCNDEGWIVMWAMMMIDWNLF